MSGSNSVSPVGSPKPVNPIALPTGSSVEDKFASFFRSLFNAGESISLDAEETLAVLGPNRMEDIWCTECYPYLIRVVAFKEDDVPRVEVGLSKKKDKDSDEYVEFNSEELALLKKYWLALFDCKTKKVSPSVTFVHRWANPYVEFCLSQCDTEVDAQVVLPGHGEITDELPYAFSIVVQKKSAK